MKHSKRQTFIFNLNEVIKMSSIFMKLSNRRIYTKHTTATFRITKGAKQSSAEKRHLWIVAKSRRFYYLSVLSINVQTINCWQTMTEQKWISLSVRFVRSRNINSFVRNCRPLSKLYVQRIQIHANIVQCFCTMWIASNTMVHKKYALDSLLYFNRRIKYNFRIKILKIHTKDNNL